MAFQFSLQTVLNLRLNQETAEQRRLAALNQEISRVDRALESLDQEKIAARRRLEEELSRGLPGALILCQAVWEESWSQNRSALLRKRAQLERQYQRQQEAFRIARQRREILDKLRDSQHQVFLIEQARLEQQLNDDLFLSRRTNRSG